MFKVRHRNMFRIVSIVRVRRAAGLLLRLPSVSRMPAIRRMLESAGSRRRRLKVALMARPDTVVFICHGNIMRSAFARAWAQARFPVSGTRFLGAGTHASRGREAQRSALRVAEEMGCSLAAHRASRLEDVEPGRNALLLCMDRANEAGVMACWPDLADRVFLIGDVVLVDGYDLLADEGPEVLDPYARGDDVTRAAFAVIAGFVDRWGRVGVFAGIS